MKFGFRTPSLKKRISARTSLKRYARHSLKLKAPKGMGVITNPKKTVYNKVYNKTTVDPVSFIKKIFGSKSKQPQPKKYREQGINNPNTQSSKGLINYFHLSDWWETAFTKSQQNRIIEVYCTLGESRENALLDGPISSTSQTKLGFLGNLTGWFNNKMDRGIANKILAKAYEVVQTEETETLDKHFLYSQTIDVYYPQRSDPKMYELAKEACYKQIEIAEDAKKAFLAKYPNQELPAHNGYYQLSIILYKEKEYQKAIEICQKALEQGWTGDWKERIERYSKKL